MATNCNTSVTGFEGSSVTTTVSAAGQIKAYVKIKPYYPPGYVPSTITSLNPSQITTNDIKGTTTSVLASMDPNVFVETPAGVGVFAGKTDTILHFKDASSGELKSDVIIEPAADPLKDTKNALTKSPAGLRVLTQGLPTGNKSDLFSGLYTWLDPATSILRVYLEPAAEILDEDRPVLDKNGERIQRNALTGGPTGYAVWTGRGEESAETYVNAPTGELRVKIHIRPENRNDCTDIEKHNALVETSEGLQVWTGSTNVIKTYVLCDTDELVSDLIVDDLHKGVFVKGDSGLRLGLSALDANKRSCPGLVVLEDGLAAFGPTTFIHGMDLELAPQSINAAAGTVQRRGLNKVVNNTTCKPLVGFAVFSMPSLKATVLPNTILTASSVCSMNVTNATNPTPSGGQTTTMTYEHASFGVNTSVGGSVSFSAPSQVKLQRVVLQPGEALTLSLTPSVTWSASNGSTLVSNEYSVEVYLYSVDTVELQ